MVPVSPHVVQWFRRNGHFDDIEAGLGVDFGGWWVVDIYHGRIEPIFYVSRDFSYPRDAKFCDEYARKGLVLITSLLEEDGLARSRHFVMVHSARFTLFEIVICE